MSLLDKILKNSTIKQTAILEDSILFKNKISNATNVPAINIALSGSIDGGMSAGMLQITGPSKHFKSAFSLLIASSFMKAHKDGVVLFYDSEFGTPESYFDSFDLPKDRIVHSPLTNVEELKHDLMTQLEGFERGDNVIIIIDSVGNLASKKEVDDALDGKSVADMTRAKALKSLGRMVTPHLTLKNIPLIIVNHVYKEIGTMFPKDIVGGGTGLYLSSDNIWIVGRQQDKDGTELTGYRFIINIEKSRHVREKSKIPVTVSFDGGIKKWSGLFDMALEGGFITEAKKGWYEYKGKNTRRVDLEDNAEVWEHLLKQKDFQEYINKTYRLVNMKPVE